MIKVVVSKAIKQHPKEEFKITHRILFFKIMIKLKSNKKFKNQKFNLMNLRI